jgi:hypothetical protein
MAAQVQGDTTGPCSIAAGPIPWREIKQHVVTPTHLQASLQVLTLQLVTTVLICCPLSAAICRSQESTDKALHGWCNDTQL